MSQYIKELTQEAHEIITNIRHAAINGLITWGQRDELVQMVLQDVADQARLMTVAELLNAWIVVEEMEYV